MQNTIILKNATKTFKDKVVFHDLNLEMTSGNSYGFVGYNGCGKSVLMKTICGFSRLSLGEIYQNDKRIGIDIDFITDAGVIIETPSFMEHLSGLKNLQLIAEIQNKITYDEIEDTLKLLDLYDDRNKTVRKYSLGMKQKLRIAQAIMEKPQILILDEPTNGLDKKSAELLRSVLLDFVKQGGLLIMASHNKTDIDLCCNHVFEFEYGGITRVTPDELS